MQVLTTHPDNIKTGNRIRKDMGDIAGLAKSIVDNGQIHPIRVDKDLNLIAGGRRLAACKLANRDVEYIIRENTSEIELRTLELEENLQRQDLSWQERVTGLKELDALKKEQYGEKGPGRSQSGWSVTDTANTVGLTRQRVNDAISLADAMEKIPELKEAKTEKDAKKLLMRLEEKMLLEELSKRKRSAGTDSVSIADKSFLIMDAFEGMAALESESVNFANVDTPYGIDLTENKKIVTGVRTDEDYTEWSRERYPVDFEQTAREVFRIIKQDSFALFWFGIEWYGEVTAILQRVGFSYDKIPCIWFGGSGGAQTMQPEKNLARSYDTFILCRKGSPVLLQRGRINVFSFDKVPPQRKIHPTEKPLELMCEIYRTFVIPGSICLSPFVGSGNDLRAAFILGSHAFGFEIDENLKNKFILRVEEDVKTGHYGPDK